MIGCKNDVIIIDNNNRCKINESFDDYLEWNGYVVIDIDEWAKYILGTIPEESIHDPNIDTGELVDSSVDNFLSDLRSNVIGTVEDLINKINSGE